MPQSSMNADSNPLNKEEKKDVAELKLNYNEKDKAYLSFLQNRLESAKKMNESPMPEFNNKTRYQYYEENEKIANTNHLEPKKNADDVVVSAGTIEQKLDSLLSHINNLNLSPEVFAFEKGTKVEDLGTALEDIIHDTEIQDGGDGAGDEEKRILRQRELLKQGTVFVQEEWLRRFEIKKKLKRKFDGNFSKWTPDDWSTELTKVFEGPSRTLLYSPNVYLGDITKFYMSEQPFCFVVIHANHEIAKTKYGKFENWGYVTKGPVAASVNNENRTIFENKWRLTEVEKDSVEIVIYQDQPNDEFQVLINGVPMMPFGFPLSAVTPRGEYNIVKQVFRVINDKFAFGGSFVSSGSVKEISAIIDEMLKLFVLKTRKSISPAYVNVSGRVIDKKVLSPGRISMGIEPNSLIPITGNEVQGVTAGEAGFLEKMQDLIDKSTVSEQFTGQKGGGNTTATEVLELQRQAKLTLGLTVAVCMLLEKKLGYLRLYNILQNWFEPTGNRITGMGDARKYADTYRKTNRDVSIEGEGPGRREVEVVGSVEELPPADKIRKVELAIQKKTGVPTRKVYISRDGLMNSSCIWYIVINPKERESSPFFKMLFREMLNDLVSLMQIGSVLNKEGIEEEFARVWGKPRNKLFQAAQMSPAMAGVTQNMPGGSQGGRPNQSGTSMMPGGLSLAGGASSGSGLGS